MKKKTAGQPLNVAQKIIAAHLVEGDPAKDAELGIRIDQTLTQDATGTMAYLQFESMDVPHVRNELAVSYVDHNTVQIGFENADDHDFLQSIAKKYGVVYSKCGNGICHQLHLERFGAPGKTLLGSDSHTPTGGGIGMLAIGAGGLDVAVAMGGGAYYLTYPKVVGIRLSGSLPYGVAAKDIILEVLRRLTVKGGVGKVMEYIGEGVKTLTVPERATIANMGAELGATTSVFPSDEVTRAFLKAQGREADFRELSADADAEYDEIVDIDLNTLEPLVAQPHMPDNVDTVKNIGPIKVDQVFIGSCTNSSYQDMMRVARILKGKTVHPDVSLVIGPGSKQVLTMLARNGALADMLGAGARILESACGPCIGMGQSPKTNAVSVRTNNRNFYARSGTASAGIYLTSCETAAVTALTGVLTDPRTLDLDLTVEQPKQFEVNDNLVIPPVAEGQEDTVDVVRGPNIKPFPLGHDLENEVTGKVLLKMEDNITTDHIMPSNAKLLPFRSNIPHLADFCLTPVDETFPARAKEEKGGILVAGANYGQGSSREHAALVPLYLGIRAVAAKSFARIHQANLINNGILPLTFADEKDYDRIDQGDTLSLPGVREKIEAGEETLVLKNETKGETYAVKMPLTERQKGMILAGGLINFIRSNA